MDAEYVPVNDLFYCVSDARLLYTWIGKFFVFKRNASSDLFDRLLLEKSRIRADNIVKTIFKKVLTNITLLHSRIYVTVGKVGHRATL